MVDVLSLAAIQESARRQVGGKALGLAHMIQAGLPVPSGFCVTTDAYRRCTGTNPHADSELKANLAQNLSNLGNGPVAVRSSAIGEDDAERSFAGQHESVLGVQGLEAILDAIERCWFSLQSSRARAYRRDGSSRGTEPAMAVVVQRFVESDIAGVLFTQDPYDAEGRRMAVEATWGIGQSVVSGRVTPDKYQIDRQTGAVVEQNIATKQQMITSAGPCAVPPERQTIPCLSGEQLLALAALGRRVEELFGGARDVEWAWADGQFWLLQARPITSISAAERQAVRKQEIAALAERAEPGGTVWSRFNLSEILPEPTPMTWAIVRRFMSGRGGFGLMYRDLGFDPDPALDEEGIFDLVCGRPYCNLSREPRVQFRHVPLEHPFALLKAHPWKALYPRPIPNPTKADWRFWLFLPLITLRMIRAAGRLRSFGATFAPAFHDQIVPHFLARLAPHLQVDLAMESDADLLRRLEDVIQLTLYDFGRDSLKPTALAAAELETIERGLVKRLSPERLRAVRAELCTCARGDPDADLPGAIRLLQSGGMSRELFLEHFGHRGYQEMELSKPRWREDSIDRLIVAPQRQAPPAMRHEASSDVWAHIVAEARISPRRQAELRSNLDRLHAFLNLRETAKHHLMKGYALIRAILVELDRRHGLGGGVFFLVPEELPKLCQGQDFTVIIRQRRRRRLAALSLDVPPVLFSDDLEAIDRPRPLESSQVCQGIPISPGVAEGPAVVLKNCDDVAGTEDYILVCPSTDPAWVPLLDRARGLVMETGGLLSHGAIVAREMGVPAVAGIPGILSSVQAGQRLRVEGGTGRVVLLPDVARDGADL